jgi:hypothetical protein
MLPMLSLDTAINSQVSSVPKRPRLIVLAFLSEHSQYKYLAIRATGVPRLALLKPDSLMPKPMQGLNPTFIDFYGMLNEQIVIVPNMLELEANISQQVEPVLA